MVIDLVITFYKFKNIFLKEQLIIYIFGGYILTTNLFGHHRYSTSLEGILHKAFVRTIIFVLVLATLLKGIICSFPSHPQAKSQTSSKQTIPLVKDVNNPSNPQPSDKVHFSSERSVVLSQKNSSS